MRGPWGAVVAATVFLAALTGPAAADSVRIFPNGTRPSARGRRHGATATTGMSHFAIQEAVNGKGVDWLEKVSDEQFEN